MTNSAYKNAERFSTIKQRNLSKSCHRVGDQEVKRISPVCFNLLQRIESTSIISKVL